MRNLILACVVILAWAVPAGATMVVLGHARAPRDGAIPCVVSIDGSKGFRLERTVPAGTGDVEVWLNANVPAGDEAAWKAKADANESAAEIPDRWTRPSLPLADIPPRIRALLRLMLDMENDRRAKHGEAALTMPQWRELYRGKRNAP